MDDDNFWSLTFLGIKIWVLTGIFILISAVVVAALRPTFLGFEREAFVESHQYVEARRTEVLTLIEQYDKLGVDIAKNSGNTKIVDALKSQQESLKIKIRAALSKIPEESWPPGARRFM